MILGFLFEVKSLLMCVCVCEDVCVSRREITVHVCVIFAVIFYLLIRDQISSS